MSDRTRRDFEAHWGTRKHHISSAKLNEARGFLKPAYEYLGHLNRPARILDAGCGDGVHAIALMHTVITGNHSYVGVDISFRAIRAICTMIDKPAYDFQTADILSLPFADRSFDLVFAYGVIAYTGSVHRVLDELCRVCAQDGLIGLWVYPEVGGIQSRLFRVVRELTKLLGRKLARLLFVVPIVFLLPLLPVRSGVNLFNSTWQQCVEIVEVNLMPQTLEFYTEEQVLEWLQEREMTITLVDINRPVAVWARN